MKFVDEATIRIKAGAGGNGCLSFFRGPNLPKGGPDGGDGGRGGSVFFEASKHLTTLADFRYHTEYKAKRGEDGRGRDQNGKAAEDLILKVPVGTIVRFADTQEVFDLDKDGKQVCVAKGGKGGLGNIHFKSSTNQAPRQTRPAQPGEERDVEMELKSMSDVGLVGFPNAGKSSLLRAMSEAKPKVGNYPFTTLAPSLGVLSSDESEERIVIADIPGLIEGAHRNEGLGHRFLKHITRAEVICYVLSFDFENNLEAQYQALRKELELYDYRLLQRAALILVNKSDLLSSQEIDDLQRQRWINEWQDFKDSHSESHLISAKHHEGLGSIFSSLEELLLPNKTSQLC